jgi:hypothetical protein
MYNILVFYEHDNMIFPMIFPSFSPAQEFCSESHGFGASELRKGAEARRCRRGNHFLAVSQIFEKIDGGYMEIMEDPPKLAMKLGKIAVKWTNDIASQRLR